MKKTTFLALFLAMTKMCFAQSFTIHNLSGCEMTYEIKAKEDLIDCGAQTHLLTLAAFSNITYANFAAVPGGWIGTPSAWQSIKFTFPTIGGSEIGNPACNTVVGTSWNHSPTDCFSNGNINVVWNQVAGNIVVNIHD